MNAPEAFDGSSSVESRIEARIAELAARVRSILQDPEASPIDVERAMSVLVPELQRLSEHVEAAGGPRYARVCESCGGLDLRIRWRTLGEAEDAIAMTGSTWTCRWCGASDFVVLELGEAISVGDRGPRSVLRRA
jgi:hypothetical protein